MSRLARIQEAWEEGQSRNYLRGAESRFRHWLMDNIVAGLEGDELVEAARRYQPDEY